MRGWEDTSAISAALLRRVEAASAAEAEARARVRAERRAARDAATAAGAGGDAGGGGAVPAAEREEQPQALAAGRRRKASGARSRGEVYRVEFICYACQPQDWDNLAGSLKDCQDALVDAGWLPGDDWDVLVGSATPRKCATRAEQRVEAILTRLK